MNVVSSYDNTALQQVYFCFCQSVLLPLNTFTSIHVLYTYVNYKFRIRMICKTVLNHKHIEIEAFRVKILFQVLPFFADRFSQMLHFRVKKISYNTCSLSDWQIDRFSEMFRKLKATQMLVFVDVLCPFYALLVVLVPFK